MFIIFLIIFLIIFIVIRGICAWRINDQFHDRAITYVLNDHHTEPNYAQLFLEWDVLEFVFIKPWLWNIDDVIAYEIKKDI